MGRFLIIAFLLIFLSPLAAQTSKHQLFVEAGVGMDVGWWVYNKGSSDGSFANDQGWDRTRTNAFFGGSFGIVYQYKKWLFGGGVNYKALQVVRMLASDHSGSNFNQYLVATNSVKFFKVYGQLGYELFNKKKFSFSPDLKIGWFNIETLHPQQDNFGAKFFWTIGLSNAVKLHNRVTLVFTPEYTSMTIKPKESLFANERHNIYSFGLLTSLRIKLTK